jgi:predicted transcriptional regulator
MTKHAALLAATLSFAALAAPPLGEKPKSVTLDKTEGGRVAGGAWSSDELKGKVFVLFYVDPDFADLNNATSEALKAEKFSLEKYQSLAVINMAATWLPNFAIDGKLKAKQKDYPDTIYVRDLHKLLVKEWKLADDNSDVIAFDQEGKLIYAHDGKLEAADIKALVEAVKAHLQ